jgi:hypothetical protein
VLVGGHAGGQDLRYDGVGDHRESEVDRTGRRRVLEVVDLTEGQHEGEDPVLVVPEDLPGLAALHSPEGEGGAGRETEGVDRTQRVGAEGHGVRVVAQLHALLDQLVDDAASIHVSGEEREDVAALQLTNQLYGYFVGLGAPDDGGETRHAPVDELDAPGTELDVVDRTVQVAVDFAVPFPVSVGVGTGEGGTPGQLEAGHRLGLQTVDESDRLDRLGSDQCRHPTVESLTQIRRPSLFGGNRV